MAGHFKCTLLLLVMYCTLYAETQLGRDNTRKSAPTTGLPDLDVKGIGYHCEPDIFKLLDIPPSDWGGGGLEQ